MSRSLDLPEIARNAAEERWGTNLPTSLYEGEFPIGERSISCAVLEDGSRLITQATFLRALGRSRSPKAGTGVLSTVDNLPFFLQSEALQPFINKELMESTTPHENSLHLAVMSIPQTISESLDRMS